jgi:hypothetical protein
MLHRELFCVHQFTGDDLLDTRAIIALLVWRAIVKRTVRA